MSRRNPSNGPVPAWQSSSTTHSRPQLRLDVLVFEASGEDDPRRSCDGRVLALAYLLAGSVACLLIVTIPFGLASFRLAGLGLAIRPHHDPCTRRTRGV